MIEQFIIGKIINTHGIKGEVKVAPQTDDINRFKKLKQVYIEKNNKQTEYKVTTVKLQNDFIIIKFEGIDNINFAETFKNCVIKVDRKDAIKLPNDRYFIADLIGLDVVSDKGEELGKIKEVLQPGGNDVYVVDYQGRELLLPAIKDVILEVDIENNTMKVHLLEGLKDI